MANEPLFINRTINDFKNRLSGGGARANLFECSIQFPDELGLSDTETQNDISFLIKTAQLPGSNVSTIQVPFRGRTLKLAGDRTYEPWTITVLNDTNFRLRNAFEKWSDYMNRHEDNSGAVNPVSYQKQIIVKQLSRGVDGYPTNASDTMKVLKEYVLDGCFPTSVDPINLSYDASDTIEEFNVTFEVQYWTSRFDNNTSNV